MINHLVQVENSDVNILLQTSNDSQLQWTMYTYMYKILCNSNHTTEHIHTCRHPHQLHGSKQPKICVPVHMCIYTCTIIIHAYTFDCMSRLVPVQCLQYLNAEALCLKPPNKALAGLSADTIVTVPWKLRVSPLTVKEAPSSWYKKYKTFTQMGNVWCY